GPCRASRPFPTPSLLLVDVVLLYGHRRNPRSRRSARMRHRRCAVRGLALACAMLLALWTAVRSDAETRPEGDMRWALYVTLSPLWFGPGEVSGQLTPFWVLYALHDALVKPMPGNLMAPSLAESWTVSQDQKTYEFKLREGLKFHNGDPFTAEDVKF